MNVRSSTRATSVGSVRARKELGLRSGLRRTSVPASTSSSVRRVHSASEPSHHATRSGLVSTTTSRTHATSRGWVEKTTTNPKTKTEADMGDLLVVDVDLDI